VEADDDVSGTTRYVSPAELKFDEVNVPPLQAYNPNLAGWFGRRDVSRLTSPRRVTLVQEGICEVRRRACLVAVF